MRNPNPWILGLCLAACGGSSVPVETGDPEPTAEATEAAPVADSTPVEVSGAFEAPMPVAVTSFGAAAAGGAVYVLGGYHGEPHVYSREGQSRDLWRFRRGEGWERVSRLAEGGLQGLALVAHGDRVCRLGGNRITNAAGEPAVMRSVDEAACFDPASGEWAALPSLPSGRSSHEAAVIGDTVYVAGGWRLAGDRDSATWQDDVVALDLSAEAPEWRAIAQPFHRRAVGVAAAAGKLIVVGGLDDERDISRRVDVFDPEAGAWSQGPDFPADAFGVAVEGAGDTVYASARDGMLYRWTVGEPAWQPVRSLAFGRFFHQLVATDAGLLAIGGIGGMHTNGRTRHVERIALDGDNDDAVSTFVVASPSAAKNRQGMFVHEGALYFFGGNNSLGQHDFEPDNFLAEGWRFHLASMTWEQVADFPANRQTMQTVSTDTQGIAVGGFGHDGTNAVTHPDAFTYDFESGEWSPRAGLPRGRTQFGLVAHDDALWIFGGLNYDPSREGEAAFDHVTNVLRAPIGEPDTAFAEVDGVELPGPRRAFAGAAHDGRYYLVGGMRAGFDLVDDCAAFDFAEQTFAPIACPSHTRLSGMLIPIGDRLYLVGGSRRGDDGMESDRQIEVYDPATDQWSVALDELPFETRHMRAFAHGDRLLLVSTHHERAQLRVSFVRLPAER